jgi:hypothetical protein
VRLTVLAGLSVACGILAGCGSSSPLGSLAGDSPSSVLAMATHAIAEAGSSFHFVDRTRVGTRTVTVFGDDSPAGAQEVLTGSAPNLQVRRTTDGVIYLQGAAAALESALGLSKPSALAHVGTWIKLEKGDAPYAKLDAALQPANEYSSYLPDAPLRFVTSPPVNGLDTTGVAGSAPAQASGGHGETATLVVPTASPYPPAGGTLTFTQGTQHGDETALFGRWGEKVDPATPAHSVSYAALAG